jgi:hypothetical protein
MINDGLIKEAPSGESGGETGAVAAVRKLPKELDRDRVVLVDKLGKGEFGEVFLGLFMEFGDVESAGKVSCVALCVTMCAVCACCDMCGAVVRARKEGVRCVVRCSCT